MNGQLIPEKVKPFDVVKRRGRTRTHKKIYPFDKLIEPFMGFRVPENKRDSALMSAYFWQIRQRINYKFVTHKDEEGVCWIVRVA